MHSGHALGQIGQPDDAPVTRSSEVKSCYGIIFDLCVQESEFWDFYSGTLGSLTIRDEAGWDSAVLGVWTRNTFAKDTAMASAAAAGAAAPLSHIDQNQVKPLLRQDTAAVSDLLILSWTLAGMLNDNVRADAERTSGVGKASGTTRRFSASLKP